MTDENENINPMIHANELILQTLVLRYGDQFAEELQVLLADIDFKKDIDNLRRQFGIIPDPKINDLKVDTFVAESVLKKKYGTKSKILVSDTSNFFDGIVDFNDALEEIMAKHNIKSLWRKPLTAYVAKDTVELVSIFPGIIRVTMNAQTQDLTIQIRAMSRNSSDLKLVAPIIYEQWNKLRETPKHHRRRSNASRDSIISRYRQSHTEKQTIDKFMDDGLDYDVILQAINRTKRARKNIK